MTMTDERLLHEIRDAIRNEMGVHVSYIREDIAALKSDLATLKRHGCSVGVANRQRLDDLDKRAATAGGIVGLFVTIIGGIISFFANRQ